MTGERAPVGLTGCGFVARTFLVVIGVTTVGIVALSLMAPTREDRPRPFAPTKVYTEILREIRVRVACDEEFRTNHTAWEDLARRRMAAASSVFEQRFGIRWNVVDVVAWDSDDAAGSLAVVLDQFESDVPRTDVDVVVGLSGQARARGSDRDYRICGMARYFGPCAVQGRTSYWQSEEWYRGALVHELGHVLGAWHCAAWDSVMQRSGDRGSTEDFDPQSTAVIELTRDLDFAKGVDWLDEARRRRMDEIFRTGHLDGMDVPYVEVELEVGRRLLARDDVAGARAAFRRAIAEQEACAGPKDPALVDVVLPLAWADLREPGRDLDEAERLERRSHDIASSNGGGEEPPCEGEALGAAIAWERGRREEAVNRLRWAHVGRLAALGACDPFTVELKERLARWGFQMRASAPAPTAAPVAPPAIRLVINVRIAADEEFQRELDWERRARIQLDHASKVFEKRFGIAWKVRDVVTWKSDDDAPTLSGLLDELHRVVPKDGADVVLGFSGQTLARGASQAYGTAGHAQLLGAAAIVRTAGDEGAATWRRGALVHELGHLLGAWHCNSSASVMYHRGDRLTADEFDPQSAAVIEMVRDAGFPRGTDWIDGARRARIRDIYRAGHEPSEVLPTVSIACWEGEWALHAGRLADARRRLTEALCEQEECVGPNDESLVKCLMALARTCRAEGPASEAEAARLERRATDILVASNRAHRQNRPAEEPK